MIKSNVNDFFICIPNEYIHKETLLSNVSSKFLTVYSRLTLQRDGGYLGRFCIKDIYKDLSLNTLVKNRAFSDIVEILKTLKENELFDFNIIDWADIGFNTEIEYVFNKEKYDEINSNFTKLYYKEYLYIRKLNLMDSPKTKNNDVLNVFLAIKSFIYPRTENKTTIRDSGYANISTKYLENIIGIGEDKINKCVDLLTKEDGLLIKYNINPNSDLKTTKHTGLTSNIFLLNQKDWQQECDIAINELRKKGVFVYEKKESKNKDKKDIIADSINSLIQNNSQKMTKFSFPAEHSSTHFEESNDFSQEYQNFS